MAKKKLEAVDDLLDALVWMRRKVKEHQPVDDLIDALVKMRRQVKKKLKMKKKLAKRKGTGKRRRQPSLPTRLEKRARDE